MATLSTGQAAKAVGKAKSSIIRAIQGGRLSASRQANGRYLVDTAELERCFGPLRAPDQQTVLPRDVPERPEAAPERDLLLDTMRDTIKRLEADGDRLRGDLADKSRDVADWRERYDKLFETHSRLMLTGPKAEPAVEDPAVREDALRGSETPPRYVRSTNGSDPVLRTLHRVRGRLGDWLGV